METFAAQPGIAKTEIFGKIDTGIAKPMATVLVRPQLYRVPQPLLFYLPPSTVSFNQMM